MSGSVDIQGLGRTHAGMVRAENQDSFIVEPELGLYVVCDGMGGHAGGRTAASTATSSIERVVRERSDVVTRVDHEPVHAPELVPVLTDAVHEACRNIHSRALAEPSLTGMGCTATALLIAGSKAAMAHVGDTRLYLVRAGEAHQLSSDHTLAAELVRQGALAPERLPGHPHAHVLTRALGPQALVEVETLSFDLTDSDRLVLCSDGVTDYIPSPAWLAQQVTGTTVEELPDELIEFANRSGGRDNATVIAIGVSGPDGQRELPAGAPQRALDILGSSFLFADLSLAQLSRVLDRCCITRYASGAMIRRSGEVVNQLLIVVSGSVRVTAMDGRCAVAGPGQHLGEHLVLRPRPVRAVIEAAQDTHVLTLDGPALRDLAGRRPWLGVALLSRLVERLSSDVDRFTGPEPQRVPDLADDLI